MPLLRGVRLQPGRNKACDTAGLVLVAGAAAGARRAEDVAGCVLDQRGARLRQELALGGRGAWRGEIRNGRELPKAPIMDSSDAPEPGLVQFGVSALDALRKSENPAPDTIKQPLIR